MDIRRTGTWMGVALAVLLAFPAVTGAAEVERKSLKLGTSRDLQLGAQILLGIHRGWFKEAGLDVSAAIFISGAEMTSAMAAGSLHFASFGDGPTANMMGGNLPIKIVAVTADISGTQQVVVRKDIKRPEDLVGKKVALTVGSSSEPLFLSFLQHYGVDPKTVSILNMRAPEQVAAFSRGDIDGFTVWQPFVLAGKRAGGHALVSAAESFMPGKAGPVDFYSAYAIYSVRRDLIECCPNTIVAVLRVLERATRYLQDEKHHAEIAPIFEKDLKIDPADARIFLKENRYDMSVDERMVKTLARTINFLHSQGKLKSKPTVDDFLDTSFLGKVNPALVKYKSRM